MNSSTMNHGIRYAGLSAIRLMSGRFRRGFRPRVLAPVLVLGLLAQAAPGATIHGRGRFERIKGKPNMGYIELYESNLFCSPASISPVGPARRLGTTCHAGGGVCQTATTHDGCYCIDNLPAGSYSILVNQPLFFITPKVVPSLTVTSSQTLAVNAELPIEYSTYFKDNGQWTNAETRWFQTFTATGTSVRGVAFVLAGMGSAVTAQVAILKDNGDPDVRNWQYLGERTERQIVVDGDNWVRWRSAEIPTVPDTRYAVRITGHDISGGPAQIQPYKRNKDANSYMGGQAYNSSGIAQNFDLNYTVFGDTDGTLVTMNRREVGLGYLCDQGFFGMQWGQTFVAGGQGLAAADVWAAGANNQWDLDFRWRVFENGPGGQQIGPTKYTKAALQSFGSGLHGVSYSPGEVMLIPGQTYYIEFTIHNPPAQSNGFNPYLMRPSPGASCGGGESQDFYDQGMAFRDGVARPNDDVSMTIVEYAVVGPIIHVQPASLTPTVWIGDPLSPDAFTVANAGAGTLNYTITDDVTWLSASPASGASTGAANPHQVNYTISGMPAGIYPATITISGNAGNSPQSLPVTLTIRTVRPDFDGDGDVDLEDFAHFQLCLSGQGAAYTPGCADADFDGDGDVDQLDFNTFAGCLAGANIPADRTCDQ